MGESSARQSCSRILGSTGTEETTGFWDLMLSTFVRSCGSSGTGFPFERGEIRWSGSLELKIRLSNSMATFNQTL